MNTGTPQGYILSPLLFSLLTHDCSPNHTSNSIIQLADDTNVTGLIDDNDESANREEVQHRWRLCDKNNLDLNTSKTKEKIMDLRRSNLKGNFALFIAGEEVEKLESFKFPGVNISANLTWSTHISHKGRKG